MDKKKIAGEVFDLFPKTEEVFVAFDGQAFFSEHSAMNHSKDKNGKAPLTPEQMPEQFKRSEMADKSKAPKLNAEQLIEKISTATTADEVDEIIGADNRASVVKAGDAKKAELAGGKAPEGSGEPVLNAKMTIEKINAATTAEEVDEIVGTDNRSTVLKAAEAKKAELNPGGDAK